MRAPAVSGTCGAGATASACRRAGRGRRHAARNPILATAEHSRPTFQGSRGGVPPGYPSRRFREAPIPRWPVALFGRANTPSFTNSARIRLSSPAAEATVVCYAILMFTRFLRWLGWSPGVPGDPRHALGRRGERVAEKMLRSKGLRVRCRQFRTPVGEIDLVCEDGGAVVFVEVKTRRDRVFADPESSVHPGKQRRLLRAAAWYVHRHRLEDRPLRYDIVTVTLGGAHADPQEVEHIEDAFSPRRG